MFIKSNPKKQIRSSRLCWHAKYWYVKNTGSDRGGELAGAGNSLSSLTTIFAAENSLWRSRRGNGDGKLFSLEVRDSPLRPTILGLFATNLNDVSLNFKRKPIMFCKNLSVSVATIVFVTYWLFLIINLLKITLCSKTKHTNARNKISLEIV